MTYKDSSEAQSALQAKLNASNVVFSKNFGVLGSETLTDGAEIKITAGTGPEDADFKGNFYIRYANTVNGRPSSLSMRTLFASLQWIEADSPAVKDGKCAYRDLKARNLNPMSNCYTLITVTDANGNKAQLPFFTRDVTLRARAVKALVPVFGKKPVEIDGVKYTAVAPPKNSSGAEITYCILQ